MSDNIPPADELHAVRAKLKELEEREAALRALMIEDADARTGNRYAAVVLKVESQRTDIKALRDMYPAIAEEHTYPVTTMRIELREVTEDGELIPVRRRKEAE